MNPGFLVWEPAWRFPKKRKRNSNFLGRNIKFNFGMLNLKKLWYQKKLYMGQFTDNSGNLGNMMLDTCHSTLV